MRSLAAEGVGARRASGHAARRSDADGDLPRRGRYETAGGRYRAARAAGLAALCAVVPAAGAYGALQLAMHWMGPPPLQSVAHLLPRAPEDNLSGARAGPIATPLDPEKVDRRYLAMLLAFEDRRFYSHLGVDPIGLARAARDLILHRRIVSGGSTLTMQVARLLDRQFKRTPRVKLRQIVRAIQLEGLLSKREILTLYLGLAPFGGRLKGVQAAARTYFGKEPQRLSVSEAALLIAVPQAPEARRLDRHPKAARRARDFVLDTVAAAGVLTAAEAELAKLEPLTAKGLEMPPAPTRKPSAPANVASLIAGLTLGINFVAGPASAAPMEPTLPLLAAADDVVLDVRRQLMAQVPYGTPAGDRDALWMFYASRREPLWVSKTGWMPRAEAMIAELERAGDWGLDPSAFAVPALSAEAAGAEPVAPAELAGAEIGLSLAVLQYARHARGGRIEDPATQLSSYLDRKPQLVPAFLVMASIAAADAPDAYLRALHPQHPEFERLRQAYLARRDQGEREAAAIPRSARIRPGARHASIPLVRHRLGVAPATEDITLYDDGLLAAVTKFQEKHGIEPADGVIDSKTRRALNARPNVSVETLLANMEQWRWMPADLGETYVWVNVPEFKVRVVKDGKVVLTERVITGEVDKQTPIFSQDLKTIYFHPRWYVPESIKVKEILPAISRGRRKDMVVTRNGKIIERSKINWSKIREYDIFQPSGPGNALGLMKFTFPNKHSVYMHDTQSKGLFSAEQRTFSHGCVRVKDPLVLAQLLLDIDKGWSAEQVAAILEEEPEEMAVPLDKHIPVHITYFTIQVDEDGELTAMKDVYGHEKRISQALQGKWDSIDKGADHLAQVALNAVLDAAPKRGRPGRRYGGQRLVSNSFGGGGDTPRASGNSANDIFRRSFGY
jgi:murein L,D-transpeptidase YcbB/YkuD